MIHADLFKTLGEKTQRMGLISDGYVLDKKVYCTRDMTVKYPEPNKNCLACRLLQPVLHIPAFAAL